MSEMVERRVRDAVEAAFAQVRETLNREVAEEIISYRELKAGVNNAAFVVQAALDALTPSPPHQG